MKTNKWCNAYINSSPLKLDTVTSEIKELIEVKTFEDFREELSDCMYSLFCAIHTYTGIILPMIGCRITLEKAEKRFKEWEEIFKQEGLKFSKVYLKNGSNYHKRHKVELAISLAKIDQLDNKERKV